MKIGEAHKTWSSSLQSANTIGAPCANSNGWRKKSTKHNLNIIGAQCLVSIAYWRRGTSVRQYPHRLTVRCASPIFIPTNRLLNELYKQETGIRWRKDDGYVKKQIVIDHHSLVSPSTSSQPLDPPNFSLPTTFKGLFSCFEFQKSGYIG